MLIAKPVRAIHARTAHPLPLPNGCGTKQLIRTIDALDQSGAPEDELKKALICLLGLRVYREERNNLYQEFK